MFAPFLEAFRRAQQFRRERSVKAWRAVLGDGLSIGTGARLGRARLIAREPQGCHFTIGPNSNIEGVIVLERRDSGVRIGSRTHVGGGALIDAACSVAVGDDVLIAFDVLIMDHDSHSLDFPERARDVQNWMRGHKDWTHVDRAPVRIEDKAWIGARSIILKGVRVGQGAVIGAGSVVVGDVPPWTVAVGNPAKVVRRVSGSP